MSFGDRTTPRNHNYINIGIKRCPESEFYEAMAKVVLNENEILSVNVVMRLLSSCDMMFKQHRWSTCGQGVMHLPSL